MTSAELRDRQRELSPTERRSEPSPTLRLVSLDALRGFDMFWIIGADSLVQGLRRVNDSVLVQNVANQLEHAAWEGFHFYDLIFPLFVFLMGVSAVFSLERIVQREGKRAAYRRLVTRSLLLYGLGLIYYGGLSRDNGPEMFRYVGVLQRIAICYFFAGLTILNFRWKGILAVCSTLLIGYWAALRFIPVGGMQGSFAEGQNLTNYIDQIALPGYKWDGNWDPEGLLSNIPAIASALLGSCAALILRRESWQAGTKVMLLVASGAVCLALGWAWSYEFPIIKKLWTSSFVLFAGGWSFLLMALFYQVIDVWRWQRWAQPFVWIGMNCITIYLLAELVSFPAVVGRVLHDDLLARLGRYDQLVVSILSLAIAVGICYELHRRRIFFKV